MRNRVGQHIPAGIDLTNVLTGGGVDSAGDEVPFTSYGRLAGRFLIPGHEAIVIVLTEVTTSSGYEETANGATSA
ncbi:hypothetical protein [Lysobacter sp. A289]